MRLHRVLEAVLVVAFCLPSWGQVPLSLQDAIAQAERTNPRLQAVVARRDTASVRARATAGMLSPQVSVSGWLAQGTVTNMLSSAPGAMPDSMRMAERDGFASAQMKLAVPLFTGGRLQAMAAAARRESEAMSAEVQEMVLEVRLEVTERYLQALLKRQLVGVAEQRLQAQEEQTRIMTQLYEVGKVPLAYLLRSRAAEAEAKQELTTARNEFQKSLLDLQVSMGVSPTGEVTLPADLQEPMFHLPGDVDEAIQRALQHRALLQAQQRLLQMRQLERRAAQGALLPQTYLTASGDWTKVQGMSAQSGYTVALVLSVPLWTGGQLEAQVREATSREREQQASLRAAQLQVENEVRRAWLDIQTARSNLATAEAALQDAEEAYRVAVLRVNEGKAPFVEQIDALAALTDARTRLFEARTELLLAQARLLRAMGNL
ncbi:MAG: TolC family protein [Chthonomonadetes bacterium]|nr:TolC family protein [Chthonomonadetes bacterium]